jgi:hypothetical protein
MNNHSPLSQGQIISTVNLIVVAIFAIAMFAL